MTRRRLTPAWWVGRPDGTLVRLRCLVLGHRWFPCEPDCCNHWYCGRCSLFGPTLGRPDPRPREFSWPTR